MRPNESGTTRVSMSRTIASLNDLRIFVTRSSADSITFDTIRKRSKPCFIPFFKMNVELFMRTYIELLSVRWSAIIHESVRTKERGTSEGKRESAGAGGRRGGKQSLERE